MRHGRTATAKIPAAPLADQPIDLEVVEFWEAFEARSTLEAIICEGARNCSSRPSRVKSMTS